VALAGGEYVEVPVVGSGDVWLELLVFDCSGVADVSGSGRDADESGE
jgi:hypothetical protein